MGVTQIPSTQPRDPKLAGEGKANVRSLGFPPPHLLHRFPQSHPQNQVASPLSGSEGCGLSSHSLVIPPPPGLTFCHSDSREASDEQAATNQQLPTWPWCRSWELMPSTKRRGSSQMSCGEAKRPCGQRGDSPVSPCRPGSPHGQSISPNPVSPRCCLEGPFPSPG